MARIRTIKPEFPQSESIGRLSREARLLFVLLWTIVDDSGRARASSRLLASLLYPFDDDSRELLEGWRDELEQQGHIRLYEVDNTTYLDIPKWLQHQKIDRPSQSHLPPFDEDATKPREGASRYRRSLDAVSRTVDRGPSTLDRGPTVAPAREASRNGKPTAGLAADAWRSRWEERHENDILRASPLDWSTLAADADKLGMAELEARIDRYLAADREWLLEHKHPLRSFLKDIAEYSVPLAERVASALIPETWCKRCGLDPAVDVRGSGCDRCRYLPDTEARKLYDERPTA